MPAHPLRAKSGNELTADDLQRVSGGDTGLSALLGGIRDT
jgi:hypothetical protein